MSTKSYLKMKNTALLIAGAAALATAAPALAGDYLAGDFHQHTLYTDGSHKFFDSMAASNGFGLHWWANSEHGGKRNRDGNGNYWDDPTVYPVNPILGDYNESGGHQNMWRWQSLRDYVFPDILKARALYPDKVVINGVEWNPPGHEHTSTAIHQYDGTATAISEFEFRFDRGDDDNSRNGESSVLANYGWGPLEKTNGLSYPCGTNACKESKDRESAKLDAIEAVRFMQALVDNGIADAWVVPAHVERAHAYFIEDFRNWMDAGPDVAIGFEGAPGHQTSGDRGFSRNSLGGGTYGGTGFYAATIGGLWDGLLAEGRQFYKFASSDDHYNWRQGGSDFAPGEYQRNYTYIDTAAADPIQAVFDGVQSGNSWNVQGDLIDELEFTAHGQVKTKAMMGETLEVEKGKMVTLKIKVRDPNTPNNSPLDMDNPSLAQIGIYQPLNMPELDHIDLIAGTITGNVPMTDLSDVANRSYVNTDYSTDTAVVTTFERGGADKNGYMTYVYNFKADKDMFFRLRGTNLPANVPFETDADGNPLADSLANDNIYASMDPAVLEASLFESVEIDTNSKLDEVAEAYADLWFYSNPIFINVVEDDNSKHGKN